ncbi:Gfo/Idh/MocA family protein [Paremcibacter congregatus]|uniref:Gfo/Idh/MocA family protein n=1 Tax=Paremcibacter congregatus TaxID=2043170 RepID=UPI003A8CF5B7
MTAKRISWGIMGCGNMAQSFCRDLILSDHAVIAAACSRKMSSARALADQFDIAVVTDDFEAMLSAPDIDIIYIATPHTEHHSQSLQALRAGKHVLCEKPMALNQRQAREIINLAREKRLFFMEALWTRFFPALKKVRTLINKGAIGAPRLLTADFGYAMAFDPTSRVFNPDLAGGALLDVGIYPLALSRFLFGAPLSLTGEAHIGPSGIDETNSLHLRHEKDVLSQLASAVTVETPQEAVIMGELGRITIAREWWRPDRFRLTQNDGAEEEFSFPLKGQGYLYEIEAVEKCLQTNITECPDMPHAESLGLLQNMDQLRQQWKLYYPGDS